MIPYHTHENGDFLSHDLLTSHRHHYRKRRDASSRDDSAAYFNVHIHSTTSPLQLNLTLSHSFIAADFKIHRRKTSMKDGQQVRDTVIEDVDHDVTCFYRGQLASKANSHVSVSVCNGMVSLFEATCRGKKPMQFPAHTCVTDATLCHRLIGHRP